MRKLSYTLKGLNCANCADSIQRNITAMDGVDAANLVFATQRLDVEISEGLKESAVTKEIRALVKRIEPEVEVVRNGTDASAAAEEDRPDIRKSVLLPAAGGVFFLLGLVFGADTYPGLVLLILSYCLAGGDVLLRAALNCARGQVFDESFLMGVATLGAFAVKQFPEAAAVMLFYKAGQLLQDMAVGSSRKSIKALMDIRPDTANLKEGDTVRSVDPSGINVGEMIVVRPGERVPLDGIVVEGRSMADTSAITGEPVPRALKVGDEIASGFLNLNGLLTVRVSRSFGQSTVSRVLELVQGAASRKAPAENFISRFARIYTPAVVAAALFLAILPPLFTGSFDFKLWVYRALVFLVVSCPCALVISIPLSYFGGIGGASRRGILVKGANYLDALNHVDTVAFDKTGTLTRGVFEVTEIIPSGEFTKSQILELAALAEANSTHPIAASILKAYGGRIAAGSLEAFEETAGRGIKAAADGKTILAGNASFLAEKGIAVPEAACGQGTLVYVCVDGSYAGCIRISDELKQDSARTVACLKKMGISKVAMLSGDREESARTTAGQLGIDEVYSGLLPHEKVEILERLGDGRKGKLLFVGDGINDAPVIARADVGAAMGALGSDAAIEAADIVLMSDEPDKIVDAFRVARKTRRIVLENIVLALGIKLLVLALSAGGMATMWEAVIADVGVTVAAVFNAMRAMRVND